MEWKEAIDAEYSTLVKQGTWVLVDLPQGRNLVDTKWIFKIKTKGDGTIQRFKARLVARGFSQQPGLDYDQTYAPVGKYTTSRVLMSIATHNKWDIQQMDVGNAFLYGTLEEEIYMAQPEGFEDGTNRVCRLIKSLYGLKQSPRAWNQELDEKLKRFGFVPSKLDSALYIVRDDTGICYMLVYVDDLLIVSSCTNMTKKVKDFLVSVFTMKDLGDATYYLGMNITRSVSRDELWLSQTKYVKNLLTRYGLQDASPSPVPMSADYKGLLPSEVPDIPPPLVSGMSEVQETTGLPLESLLSREDKRLYQSIVGSLMFAASCTRPDIAYAVSQLAQATHYATLRHLKAAYKVLRYLKGTVNQSLCFRADASINLVGYTDADWGGCPTTRRSTTGVVFTLGGAAVSWTSKKQQGTALSTCEAEYSALTTGTKECIWLQDLLLELDVQITKPTVMHVDNTAAIALTQNSVLHARTKHVAIHMHFVRQEILKGRISIVYTPTDLQIADYLTKSVSVVVLQNCRAGSGQTPDRSLEGESVLHLRGSVENTLLHWLCSSIDNGEYW